MNELKTISLEWDVERKSVVGADTECDQQLRLDEFDEKTCRKDQLVIGFVMHADSTCAAFNDENKLSGKLLSNDAEQCLSYTGMLVEHFNAHVRYGAAMALGISCAGSGYKLGAEQAFRTLFELKSNFYVFVFVGVVSE
ncbi:unnamed protein product [Anisakis simplex]|uniref:Dynein light chain n=1 Tax=Anisakis simplex TaxID=6269 RepID=A0A0M3K5M7_ANISI|nr:unnamed protein product [Anisakis simplex]